MLLPLQKAAQDSLYAAVKGKLEREKFKLNFFPILPSFLYVSALPHIQEISERCFKLYKEQSVVIKYNTPSQSATRHQNNLLVSKFVIENRFKAITVPRTRLHGNAVIDELLPVKEKSYIADFGFYLENAPAFDQAVEEFFRLLCCIRIYDIRGNNKVPYGTLVKNERYGRYDNVCLYIEDGMGKIGLVDLEEISDSPTKEARLAAIILRDLICLFPLHFSLIIKLGHKKFPAIESYRKIFDEIKIEQDAYIKLIYTDHKAWQEARGILREPASAINITDADEVKIKVREYLFKEGVINGIFDMSTLGIFFEKDYQTLFDSLIDWLNNKLNKAEAVSAPEIIAHRTVFGTKKQGETQESKISLGIIVDAIFFALKDSDIIYDYRPNFGVEGYARPTIFC